MKTTNRVICNAVCTYFGMDPLEIFQKTRKGTVVFPRQLFHYLAAKWTANTLAKIGNYGNEAYRSGYYDHATVLHSKKLISNLLYINDKEVCESIIAIEAIITKSIFIEHSFIPTNVHLLSKCKNSIETIIL